jgi:membrane-bound ClpP family serine protease
MIMSSVLYIERNETTMEILFNPNIAYLLLVAGFALAILAVVTPGTGLIELGALFALLLAAYSVIAGEQPVNYWALAVLILGVFPFLLAVRRSGKPVYLALSLLALVIGSAYLFHGSGWLPGVNPFLALVVSILVGGFFWVAVQKVLEAEQRSPAHSLETLLGETGEARTDILTEGSVYIDGEMWSAESEHPIPAGARVRVISRSGLILKVETVTSK